MPSDRPQYGPPVRPTRADTDLLAECVYDWGDFLWADYSGDSFPRVSERELKELTLFASLACPPAGVTMSNLGNRYLCQIHDDGWFLRLFYQRWEDVVWLIGDVCRPLDLGRVRAGDTTYWVSGVSIDTEERTLDPDLIIRRRYRRSR